MQNWVHALGSVVNMMQLLAVRLNYRASYVKQKPKGSNDQANRDKV